MLSPLIGIVKKGNPMTTEILQWATVILLALIWLAPRRPQGNPSDLADIRTLLIEIREELRKGNELNKHLAAIDDKTGYIFMDVQKIAAYKADKNSA